MSESTGGRNPGQLYTYVKIDENSEECCEGTTASFRTYCINYSLCDCEKNPETCCSKKEKPATPYPGYSIADLLIKTKTPGQNEQDKGQQCVDPNGNRGTCNHIVDIECRPLLGKLIQDGLPLKDNMRNFLTKAIQSPCRFVKHDYTVCCAPNY